MNVERGRFLGWWARYYQKLALLAQDNLADHRRDHRRWGAMGAADLRQGREDFFVVARQIFCSGGRFAASGRGGIGGREERKNAAEGGRRARDFKRGCSKMAENSHFWTKKNSYRQERKKYGIICGVVRRNRAG